MKVKEGYQIFYEGGYSVTWGLDDIICFALRQIEQVNAGCPADCDKNPLYCTRDQKMMPRQCFQELPRCIMCGDVLPPADAEKYGNACGSCYSAEVNL